MLKCAERRGLSLPLALSMGDPAGIGGEIALCAWQRRERDSVPLFFTIDDPERLRACARRLSIEGDIIRPIASPEAARDFFSEGLPVLALEGPVSYSPGDPTQAGAVGARASLDLCLSLVCEGRAAGLITNPVFKLGMKAVGMDTPGQSEYIATACGESEAGVMLLSSPLLKTALVTTHLPLCEVSAALTREKIVHVGTILELGLKRDFGLSGRIAVCGLNPHAGEGGILGREEIEIIAPAIEVLAARGIEVSGPHSADSLFHAAARRTYDAALCMYHDQALIPLKTLDFARGVNVTLGLPIVRTSPDHGTGFDIAGRGCADPSSLIAALKLAGEIARIRIRTAAR